MSIELKTKFRFSESVLTALETVKTILAFITPTGSKVIIKDIPHLEIAEMGVWNLARDRLAIGTERVLRVHATLNLFVPDQYGVCDKPSKVTLEFEIDKTRIHHWSMGQYSYVTINEQATLCSAAVFTESARRENVHVLAHEQVASVIKSIFTTSAEDKLV